MIAPEVMGRAGAALTGDRGERIVDFNIHKLVGIRLLSPSTSDVRTVERHLGLRPTPFDGEPAITIRFVDALPIDGPLRFVGQGDVAFTDSAFVLLRSRNLARARAQLALETVGETCEITCESRLPEVPLLRQLINLAMLARGIIPIHAAAFRHAGRGVLVTGWSHGSKTGTLLAFMAAGAEFVGDEWIYLSASGDRMYGLPDQLEARPWYLRELPDYQRHVSGVDRIRTELTHRFARVVRPLVSKSERGNSIPKKLIRYLYQSLLDQQSIKLRPLQLFGSDACSLHSSLDVLIVAISHEAPDVQVEPTPTDKIAAQITASFVHEQANIVSSYHKHLFAFPSRRNPLLDDLERVYRALATEALKGKNGNTMLHPYPVSIGALRTAVQPLLSLP